MFEVLKFVCGRPVAVSDMLRVGGHFASGKTRPVVVKLYSAWDRRMVLSNTSKLKSFRDRIYIAPDEPREVRRQHTLDRLRIRAEREGKAVSVVHGKLSVNGVVIYSLIDGAVIQSVDSDSQ